MSIQIKKAIKDYYRILHVARDARLEEIKKAFRKLAHEYHPDKNPENEFAPAYFREIQEAYRHLSNSRSRRAYDLDWARQGGSRNAPPIITAAFLFQEAQKLSRQIAELRPYRMDTGFLFASLQYLLADDHLAVLLQNENSESRSDFLLLINPLLIFLPYSFLRVLEKQLLSLTHGKEVLRSKLLHLFALKQKEQQRARIFPWLVVLVTLLLCLTMFWYGRR